MDAETKVLVETAPAWRPAAGEQLTASIAAILRRETQYGAYPVVVFQLKDGTFTAWHAMHSIAQDALKARRPAPGDTLTVHYGGRIESKKRKDSDGKPVKYHAWTIVSENDADDSWDFGDAPTDEPGY
jgi:C4-dicarboxylate-specific signal transduction histidine kinase